MIAADHQGKIIRSAIPLDYRRQVLAHTDNRFKIPQARMSLVFWHNPGLGNDQVPLVDEGMPKFTELFLNGGLKTQTSITNSVRPQVYPVRTCAQV